MNEPAAVGLPATKYGYVYHTFCTASKKHYIGQHVGAKFDSFYLGSGKILKRAVLKYGEDAFEVTPIKWCASKEELNLEEIWQITRFRKRYGKRKIYNITNGGGGISSESWTPEMRGAISRAHKGIKLSKEHRAKISAAEKGVPKMPLTKEHCAAISRARKGVSLSIAHRRAIGKAGKGREFSKEHRRKISAALQGRPSPLKGTTFTAVHCRRISSSNKGRRSPMLGRQHSKESREKMRIAVRDHWATDQNRRILLHKHRNRITGCFA